MPSPLEPPVPLIDQQRAERRERILETARRLIGERGYDGVTMRDLAEASRVSVPTLYNQFGGKQELLFAAVESHFSGLLQRDAPESARGLPRLLAIVERCAAETLARARYNRALLAGFAGSGATRGLGEQLARELGEELGRALAEMKRGGELAEWVDPRVLGEQVAGHCIGTSLAWAAGRLDDAALVGSMNYGSALMVLGAARHGAVAALERHAAHYQSVGGSDAAERSAPGPVGRSDPARVRRT
jgi:AcrR family transcriptional regulator